MSFWVLVQVLVNFLLLAGFGFVWFRLARPPKDDPRLSRGLQLLQSKISVLEDLSDRTETQAAQIIALMEQKCKEVQNLVAQSEKQLQKIEGSMAKSLDVAKIFQDKIPHQEIIERQNTVKYVKAARMAHQGASIEEIASQVDLTRGEIEFIAKVNKDQLQFSEEHLPEWSKEEPEPMVEEPVKPLVARAPEKVLSDLGAQFRQAFQQPVSASPSAEPAPIAEPELAPSKAVAKGPRVKDNIVKKVVFPKLEVNSNLG